MSDEASNILRRFIRVVTRLGPDHRYLRQAARTLRPEDLRLLAWEVNELMVRQSRTGVAVVIRADDPPHVKPLSPVNELRGLARSIITYGGSDAVRRDADPRLVEWVNRIGWNP